VLASRGIILDYIGPFLHPGAHARGSTRSAWFPVSTSYSSFQADAEVFGYAAVAQMSQGAKPRRRGPEFAQQDLRDGRSRGAQRQAVRELLGRSSHSRIGTRSQGRGRSSWR